VDRDPDEVWNIVSLDPTRELALDELSAAVAAQLRATRPDLPTFAATASR
jgi:hypothetical protein